MLRNRAAAQRGWPLTGSYVRFMPVVRNGEVEIYYETAGDPGGRPILFVMGLGAQLIAWHEDWCQGFVDAGRFVVRFDNRDCGLSTKFKGVRVDLAAVMAAWAGEGPMPSVPYLLSDMAADAVAVLDDLGIDQADIVGGHSVG